MFHVILVVTSQHPGARGGRSKRIPCIPCKPVYTNSWVIPCPSDPCMVYLPTFPKKKSTIHGSVKKNKRSMDPSLGWRKKPYPSWLFHTLHPPSVFCKGQYTSPMDPMRTKEIQQKTTSPQSKVWQSFIRFFFPSQEGIWFGHFFLPRDDWYQHPSWQILPQPTCFATSPPGKRSVFGVGNLGCEHLGRWNLDVGIHPSVFDHRMRKNTTAAPIRKRCFFCDWNS